MKPGSTQSRLPRKTLHWSLSTDQFLFQVLLKTNVDRTANNAALITRPCSNLSEIKVGVERRKSQDGAHNRSVEAISERAQRNKKCHQEVVGCDLIRHDKDELRPTLCAADGKAIQVS
jgi:hypothetical protein